MLIDVDQLVTLMRTETQTRKEIEDYIKLQATCSRTAAVVCKHYLPGQSYGTLLEAFLKRKFDIGTKQNETSGDGTSKRGNIEIKVSLGQKGDKWCMQQIRPHHNVGFYLVMLYSLQDDEVTYLLIPHRDVLELVLKHCTSYAHGTKELNGTQISKELINRTTHEYGLFFNKFAKKGTKPRQIWDDLSNYVMSEEELMEFFHA